MYPFAFDCECCGDVMCLGSDFSWRLNSTKESSSESSESSVGSGDFFFDMFCFPSDAY